MNSIPDSIRETCDLCDGHGRLGLGSECPPCKGSGVRIRSPYAAKSSVGLHDDDDVRIREPEKALAEEIAKRLKVTAQKDGAYSERNKCVALIARMALALGWRAGVGRHPESDETWEHDWRTILFVDLPTGQASWHFHDSERHLLEGLPEYLETWDGHSTEEKYRRALGALR